MGEDPPSDVNGDGVITTIRVPSPEGEWIEDPTDPRALVKADPKKGQRGKWKLWTEGRDLDRDERVAEDSELDAVVNLNFPQGWRELDPRAGRFATDEPPAHALCDFVLLHKDIALVLTYGAQDNLVEKPKTIGDGGQRTRRPTARSTPTASSTPRSASATRSSPARKPRARTTRAARSRPGASSSAACGASTSPAGRCRSTSPRRRRRARPRSRSLRAINPSRATTPSAYAGSAARFVAWKPFQHPELGAVEIGGFAPYAKIEPPESERVELEKKQYEFLLTLGELLPRVVIPECSAKALSGGLWEIKAAVENHAFLPLLSAAARRAESVRPARVTLRLPKDAQLLAGSGESLLEDLTGTNGRHEYRWLVHGAPPKALGVEVETDHAGNAQATPEVK